MPTTPGSDNSRPVEVKVPDEIEVKHNFGWGCICLYFLVWAVLELLKEYGVV